MTLFSSSTLPSRRLGCLLTSLLLLLVIAHQAEGIFCVQCDGHPSGGEEETDECIAKPPAPTPCGIAMNGCITIRTYIPAEQDKRALMSLVRTCAPTDMGWDCKKARTEDGAIAEVCHDTCTWDGCNHGHFLTSSSWTIVLLFLTSLWIVPRL